MHEAINWGGSRLKNNYFLIIYIYIYIYNLYTSHFSANSSFCASCPMLSNSSCHPESQHICFESQTSIPVVAKNISPASVILKHLGVGHTSRTGHSKKLKTIDVHYKKSNQPGMAEPFFLL